MFKVVRLKEVEEKRLFLLLGGMTWEGHVEWEIILLPFWKIQSRTMSNKSLKSVGLHGHFMISLLGMLTYAPNLCIGRDR